MRPAKSIVGMSASTWLWLLALMGFALPLSGVAEWLDGTALGGQLARPLSAVLPFAERLAQAPRPEGQTLFYAVLFWTAPLFVWPLRADIRRQQIESGLPAQVTDKWWQEFGRSALIVALSLVALWLVLGFRISPGSWRINPWHSAWARALVGPLFVQAFWIGLLTAWVQIRLLRRNRDEPSPLPFAAKPQATDEKR
jgi:hypothetical protein